ncbi:hypothetical protein ANN_05364 [Periplaneta americana]|uniref:Reverse transcriptase n=1 Tax=Periplaneta americana TaxID=6978 RepID=A0ABQ8TCQ5_PERAM|nr:hypothetical protein ANN_05364 [Periplaneta americana]
MGIRRGLVDRASARRAENSGSNSVLVGEQYDARRMRKKLREKELEAWANLPQKGLGGELYSEFTPANSWIRHREGLTSSEWREAIKMAAHVSSVRSLPDRTRDNILCRMDEERMVLKLIRKRERNWLGNWLRRNCLLKDALEGMMNGRRVWGGRRYQIIDNIKIYGSYEKTKRKAENRKDWRMLGLQLENQYIANTRDLESELKTSLGKLPLDNNLISPDTIKNKRGLIDSRKLRKILRIEEFNKWCQLPQKGKGVSLYQDFTPANSWVRRHTGLSSSEWRDALKMTGNVAPVRAVPGRTQDNNHCRRCHSEVETLIHVLGSCPFGETLRNSRHHKIKSVIATCLQSNGYTIYEGVHRIADTGSHRRIDIITFKPGETKVNCPKTGLNLTSDTNKASLMKQLSQEKMGQDGEFLSISIVYIAD